VPLPDLSRCSKKALTPISSQQMPSQCPASRDAWPRLLELGKIFEDDGLPRFFAHYVLLTSVFEIKRTGFNDALGAIHCMLEETIERFGVIIAIDRVVDVVVREGEPLLFFRGAYR
jgi:hypothetical protein